MQSLYRNTNHRYLNYLANPKMIKTEIGITIYQIMIKFEQNDLSKGKINRFFVELQCSDLKGNYNQFIWKQVNLLDSGE